MFTVKRFEGRKVRKETREEANVEIIEDVILDQKLEEFLGKKKNTDLETKTIPNTILQSEGKLNKQEDKSNNFKHITVKPIQKSDFWNLISDAESFTVQDCNYNFSVDRIKSLIPNNIYIFNTSSSLVLPENQTLYLFNNTNDYIFIRIKSNHRSLGTIILYKYTICSNFYSKPYFWNPVMIFPSTIGKKVETLYNPIGAKIYNNRLLIQTQTHLVSNYLFGKLDAFQVYLEVLEIKYDKYIYLRYENEIIVLNQKLEKQEWSFRFEVPIKLFIVSNQYLVIYTNCEGLKNQIWIYSDFSLVKTLDTNEEVFDMIISDQKLYLLKELKLSKIDLGSFDWQTILIPLPARKIQINHNLILLILADKVCWFIENEKTNFQNLSSFQIFCFDSKINTIHLGFYTIVLTTEQVYNVYVIKPTKLEMVDRFINKHKFGKILEIIDGYGVINDTENLYYLK